MCSGLSSVFALEDDTSLNCAMAKICKVCKRKTLIIPSIYLERSKKESDYFSVLLAYILMFLKLGDICNNLRK